MATTVNTVIGKNDQFLRDTSTNSVTQADRFRAISEATQELMVEFGFDQMNLTYTLNYFDTINYYKVTTSIPWLLEPVDLRRAIADHDRPFFRNDPRSFALALGTGSTENSFTIEKHDTDIYVGINFSSKYEAKVVHDCESLTSNGTWAADTVNSDAKNLTLDTVTFSQGAASLSFDIDTTQSSNNRATLTNSTMSAVDMTSDYNVSSMVLDVWIPSITNFTSVTVYWGTDSSNYYSATATTDVNGNTLVAGKNTIKVDWTSSTTTGTPTLTNIVYLRLDFNYSVAYTNQTSFRVDYIRMIRPEPLTFYYQGWHVGTNSGGTKLAAFTATTDIPFYSGQYDQFDNPIAHRSAAILFRQMGMHTDAQIQDGEYKKEMDLLKKRFPSSGVKETKNFKVKGINFATTNTRRISHL